MAKMPFKKDWKDVSDAFDKDSIKDGDCWEPCTDLPSGWGCHLNPYSNTEPYTYIHYAYKIEVKGCKNIYVADQKICKMQRKYKIHVKCECCKRTPCCLEEMAELLADEGDKIKSRSSIQNNCICYYLYCSAVHLYFGFLGWGDRKKLPICMVKFILNLYPKGYNEDYTDFVKDSKYYYPDYY